VVNSSGGSGGGSSSSGGSSGSSGGGSSGGGSSGGGSSSRQKQLLSNVLFNTYKCYIETLYSHFPSRNSLKADHSHTYILTKKYIHSTLTCPGMEVLNITVVVHILSEIQL
jgi:hypothetical protein